MASVPGTLNADGYLDERITGTKGNLKFYDERANEYASKLKLLSAAQFAVSILGAATRRGGHDYRNADVCRLGCCYYDHKRCLSRARASATVRAPHGSSALHFLNI